MDSMDRITDLHAGLVELDREYRNGELSRYDYWQERADALWELTSLYRVWHAPDLQRYCMAQAEDAEVKQAAQTEPEIWIDGI